MNRPQPINILEVCALFEVDPKTLPDMMKPGPMPVLEKKLEKFKAIFKKAYRKLAIELHPDHGATEEQVERFKKLTSIYKEFEKLKIVPVPKPRPMPMRVVIRTYGGGGYSSTSSSTTGGWGGGNTWYWSSSGGGDNRGTGE